ncbi:putative hydrolase of the HAD superfamily [Balneicella halophila]|uniref:Putative hydrolase of the HAD superfamily n=1 Tax=Balneicella halophila TaxID=1537566 RepID=A0A7L4UR20_BALHA|nr:HAD family hydrolase [Balneicella halophila]PVX52200.1 putative hydrolase of the HAD superfamily [Balneicella halophila]
MSKYDEYEVLIFDLGNTILPIAPELTIQSFQSLGFEGDILKPHVKLKRLLSNYQKGEVSTTYFLSFLQNELSKEVAEYEVVEAWNAMLLDFPKEHIALIKQLKETHQLILLSNTNELHTQCFQAKAASLYFRLSDYFHKVYYSQELGMSKPDKEIFDFVHKENLLDGKKVLFLDDLEENLVYPQEIGWNVGQVSTTKTILEWV